MDSQEICDELVRALERCPGTKPDALIATLALVVAMAVEFKDKGCEPGDLGYVLGADFIERAKCLLEYLQLMEGMNE